MIVELYSDGAQILWDSIELLLFFCLERNGSLLSLAWRRGYRRHGEVLESKQREED